MARVVVDVMPKAEILDPQGQAISGALGRLGFDGIADVLAEQADRRRGALDRLPGQLEVAIGRHRAFMLFSFSLIPAALCCFLAARTAAADEARIAARAS